MSILNDVIQKMLNLNKSVKQFKLPPELIVSYVNHSGTINIYNGDQLIFKSTDDCIPKAIENLFGINGYEVKEIFYGDLREYYTPIAKNTFVKSINNDGVVVYNRPDKYSNPLQIDGIRESTTEKIKAAALKNYGDLPTYHGRPKSFVSKWVKTDYHESEFVPNL